jgi:5-methylcytosine-specific restriction endonuclease McrA
LAKWRRVKSLSRIWQRKTLVNKYGAICYLCNKPFVKIKDITIDHWQPLSKGGSDNIENYRLAHLDCNNLKKDLTPEQWLEFQSGIIKYE